jgi:MYXO-CTERM domain-containing protein
MRTRTLASALLLAGVLTQPVLVQAQQDPTATGDTTTTTSSDRDDRGEWGWLGLLGLVGLLGLRRRDHVTERRDTAAHRPV